MDKFFGTIGAVANASAPFAAVATFGLYAAVIVIAVLAAWGLSKLARNARERRLAPFRPQHNTRVRVPARHNKPVSVPHAVPAE